MAGFQKIYTSENEYLYDLGKTTGYFDEEYYNLAKESGVDYQYLQMMASLKQTGMSTTFDPNLYNKLSGEERFNYLATENFMDKSSKEYVDSVQYFKQREQEIKNDEIYASLNGFQKTMNTFGGWFADAAVSAYSTLEGLLNAGGTLLGGASALVGLVSEEAKEFSEDVKDWVAKDVTGATAAKNALAEWRDAYTFENSQGWLKVVNDVASAIGQMTPMIAGTLLAPVTGGASLAGTVTYYTAMAGNSAEQAIVSNPDIDYGRLYAYTLGTTALEMGTEWLSGKIFGEGLIGLKGINKEAMTGGILKNITHNMYTEALEEATSEIFGSLMEYYLVTEKNPESLPTIENILYAALIGGLTGGFMAGGRVVLTPRMVVTEQGDVEYRKNLSKEELSKAKKTLGLRESWSLQSLLQQSSEALSQIDNITKLQAKYGDLSLQQIQEQHADEYNKAFNKDVKIKEKQAKSFLSLSKLMNEIGVEKFSQAVDLLNNAVEDARVMADNYINRTVEGNKKAAEVYSKNFEGQSFTPTAIPSKANQTLAQAIRRVFPNVKVVFGKFGSENGSPVRAMNGAETYIFIDENMVSRKGYKAVLRQAIRYQLADQLMLQLEALDASEVDTLVSLFTDSKESYSSLAAKQKLTIAQMLCFDPVNTRKLFGRDMKIHKKIFKYISDKTAYEKKFGKQDEGSKIRYHDLLGIRNMYLKNIADTIGNMEDVNVVENEYNLTPEEVKTKIVDKLLTTPANDTVKITDLKQSKQAVQKREAFNELNNARQDTTTPFDFDRMWDKDYYTDEFVANVTQTESDFRKALEEYILRTHNVQFGDKTEFTARMSNTLSANDVELIAKALMTKEYLDSNPTFENKKAKVIDALYIINSIGVDENALKNVDTIVQEGNQLKGTGKLKYLKVRVDERNNIYNDQRQGRPSESAREQVGDVVTKSTTIANKVTINEIDETSYNDRQKEMVKFAEKEYGVNLHFYEGSAVLKGYDTNTDYGLNGFIYGDDDIYIRYDDTLSESVIERVLLHEGTHKLIAENPEAYKELRDIFKQLAFYWDAFVKEYSSKDMYGDIYDDVSDIEEEIVVDICCGRVTGQWTNNTTKALDALFEFYNKTSHVMYSQESNFYKKDTSLLDSETSEKPRKHILSSNTAAWTQDRLDIDLQNVNKYHTDPNKVVAYAAFVNPHDFIAATTNNARVRSRIRQDMRDYADKGVRLEDMKTNLETPYLEIDPISMEIVDHQGRHRMWSMYEAGITEVPVLIFGYGYSDIAGMLYLNENNQTANKILKDVTFKGQTWDSTQTTHPSKTYITFYDMIPFNESHRTDLEKYFVKGVEISGGPKFRFAKDKTPKKNITEQDITSLASTDYRSGKTDVSTAKGFQGREYEVSSVIDYEAKNGETLRKIKTLDDLKLVLDSIKNNKIDSPERGFVLDLLQTTVLPFNFKGDRYAKAKALFDEVQAIKVTKTAQEMASRSELFGESNPMKSLADELSEKFGTEIRPSDKMMIKWVPMYADRTNWLNRLKAEYDQIVDLRKNTEDPYMKEQYTMQLRDLRMLSHAVAENDTATILDITVRQLQDTDVNKAKNSEKVTELIKDFVTELVTHTDASGKQVKYDPNKKYVLKPEHAEKILNFWNKINAFRYLAMLSSPATMGRNALTNTLIAANAIVEDGISSKIEKSKLLRQESQANFTGDYDQAFDKFIEDRYSARIAKDTKGDKYHTTELEQVRQEWAAENDPLKKSKFLYRIKKLEQKGLNDQPWTKRRVMRNLKNTLAGSMNLISKNAHAEVKAMYKGDTDQAILDNMKKTGSPLAKAFEKAYIIDHGANMVSIMELASQLTSTSVVLDQIYDNALYRGNKLLFKTDNILTKKIGQLRKKHPMTAAFVTAFIPFARTSWNTSAYILNHSPLGLAKGIMKALQTKNMYYGDMRLALYDYHKTEYLKQHASPDTKFKFDEQAFTEWCNTHLAAEVVRALNGDYNAIKNVFDQYVKLGRVNQNLIGSSDIFARATTIESITQGLTGTAWLALGLVLGALCDGFMIDEDDYLGPVIKIGDLRIKLDDLSPFSTMFSVGAVLNSSDGFLDGFEQFINIIVDASMLNLVGSAIQYSDSLPDYLGGQQINFVQQFIPAIFKSFTKIIDNNKKNKSGNFYEKLIKTTLSNTPLFSYLVADKIDPYTGETEKIYQSGLLEALFHAVSPLGLRTQIMSDFEREARKVGAETAGFTGRFSVNDKDYDVKNLEKYSKYRAEYINTQMNLILSNKQLVTVENDDGKRITTTYDKLTDKQKKNVLSRLYSDATTMTKIKWWTDLGNTYVVTNRDLYSDYRTMFDNVVYKNSWNKSKFMEG